MPIRWKLIIRLKNQSFKEMTLFSTWDILLITEAADLWINFMDGVSKVRGLLCWPWFIWMLCELSWENVTKVSAFKQDIYNRPKEKEKERTSITCKLNLVKQLFQSITSRSIGNINEKLSPAWVMTHVSSIPKAPCTTCRQLHWRVFSSIANVYCLYNLGVCLSVAFKVH